MPAETNCLPAAPPVEWAVVPTVDDSCPAQFAICFTVDAGLALEHNVKALRRYNTEAWNRCGGSVDAGSPDAGHPDAGH